MVARTCAVRFKRVVFCRRRGVVCCNHLGSVPAGVSLISAASWGSAALGQKESCAPRQPLLSKGRGALRSLKTRAPPPERPPMRGRAAAGCGRAAHKEACHRDACLGASSKHPHGEASEQPIHR